MSKPLYRIKDWKTKYEFGDFKKCSKASWYPKRTKHDGKTYKRLMEMKNGPELYLAWTLIEAVASKCPERGTLKDEDGPLDAEDLALITCVPARYFIRAFKPLCDIKWLEIIDGIPNHSESVGMIPPTRQDKTGHNNTLLDGAETEGQLTKAQQAENIYQVYPKKTGKQAALAEIRKILSDPESGKSYETLLEATEAYGASVKLWPTEDRKFVPDPERWFRKGRYDDDRSTWQRNNARYRITKDHTDPEVAAILAEGPDAE